MLAQLPQDWQNWVLENIGRGCAPADMQKQLVENRVAPPLAAAVAIREASEKLARPLETKSLPKLQFDGDFAEIDGHCLRRSMWLESPRVAVIEDMLSPEECAAFIELGKEQLRAITVVDPDSGGTQFPWLSGLTVAAVPGRALYLTAVTPSTRASSTPAPRSRRARNGSSPNGCASAPMSGSHIQRWNE